MPLVTVSELRGALDLSAAIVSDDQLAAVCLAAQQTLVPYLRESEDHGQHENCRAAGLAVAVQIWTARTSPGGRITATDMGPMIAPHVLGPQLQVRLRGIIGRCWDIGGMIG